MIKRRRTKISTTEIIKLFREKHGFRYSYAEVVYKTMHDKVDIICLVHGNFSQVPKDHLSGKGCRRCGISERTLNQTSNTTDFIEKSRKKFGDKLTYDRTLYGATAHEKLILTCKEHGDFTTTPNNHLSSSKRATGCPSCKAEASGWNKTSWKKQCEGRMAKLYVIRCWNKSEEFYKIGITSRDNVTGRFNSKLLMPYEYEVITLIQSMDSDYIFSLEKELHRKHRKYKYVPSIWFDGRTECFTNYSVD